MNKTDLVNYIAEKAELTKVDSTKALNAVLAAIKEALEAGDDVTLIGFGTFTVSERKARDGRNPRTGKKIKIKASKVPKFRAGKGLKEAVAAVA
jgi:DNA-binding protein HU-beta